MCVCVCLVQTVESVRCVCVFGADGGECDVCAEEPLLPAGERG